MPYALLDDTPQKQWTRLRQIMYQPSAVWLSTDYQQRRWLTDQYVLYDVTALEALYCYDSSYEVVWPDGPYQLTVGKGFKPRDSIPEPDIEVYFDRLYENVAWKPTRPTEWSVAEHPGKAMLWSVADEAVLLGESTWTAIHRHYPEVVVDYGVGILNVFRFSRLVDGEDPETPAFQRLVPFCYAAGIEIPDGQEAIAEAIVSVA